jgi:hypothetical protein
LGGLRRTLRLTPVKSKVTLTSWRRARARHEGLSRGAQRGHTCTQAATLLPSGERDCTRFGSVLASCAPVHARAPRSVSSRSDARAARAAGAPLLHSTHLVLPACCPPVRGCLPACLRARPGAPAPAHTRPCVARPPHQQLTHARHAAAHAAQRSTCHPSQPWRPPRCGVCTQCHVALLAPQMIRPVVARVNGEPAPRARACVCMCVVQNARARRAWTPVCVSHACPPAPLLASCGCSRSPRPATHTHTHTHAHTHTHTHTHTHEMVNKAAEALTQAKDSVVQTATEAANKVWCVVLCCVVLYYCVVCCCCCCFVSLCVHCVGACMHPCAHTAAECGTHPTRRAPSAPTSLLLVRVAACPLLPPPPKHTHHTPHTTHYATPHDRRLRPPLLPRTLPPRRCGQR